MPGNDGKVVSFYSYGGGIGRSAALAAVAWIMARSGLRVLVVDWELDSPALDRHFRGSVSPSNTESIGVVGFLGAFLDASTSGNATSRRALATRHAKNFRDICLHIGGDFSGAGTLDFVPAGRPEPGFGLDWRRFYHNQGGTLLTALRSELIADYDYVLVDCRTGVADRERLAMVVPADVVVIGFTLTTPGIEQAADTIRHIESRGGQGNVRLLPVPMSVDMTDVEGIEAARGQLRSVLGPLLSLAPEVLERYWNAVEIPYQRPTLFDGYLTSVREGGRPTGLLSTAYEHLASAIVGDPRLPDGRDSTTAPAVDVQIEFASADRYWSEWVAAELSDAGLRVRRQPADTVADASGPADRHLVLLSADLLRELPAAAASRQHAVVVARLDGAFAPPSWNAANVVDLEAVEEEAPAATALRVALALPPREALGGVVRRTGLRRPRFPAARPSVRTIPNRNAQFAGPGSMVDLIRERLLEDGRPLVLSGPSGVAKSVLALEYAHRFEADYDVVWWIDAETPDLVRAGLFDVADAMGLPRGRSDSVEPLLAALGNGRPYERWLLVYDGVEAPGDVSGLVPNGSGHVLITSRDVHWESSFFVTPVSVLTHDQAVAYVKRLVEISDDDAAVLAKQLGDTPSILDVACAYLVDTGTSVSGYLALLARHSPGSASRSSAGVRLATGPVLVSLDLLRERRPAAAKALELCAFLGPEPIPLSVLHNDVAHAELVADNPAPGSRWLVGLLTHQIERLGLAKVDNAAGTIQLTRVVQVVIQASLPEPEAEAVRTLAYRALAAAERGDPDEPARSGLYKLLLPHATRADVLECAECSVRDMVVDVTRFRYKRGDFEGSANLARHAHDAWIKASGPDDPICLEIQYHRANALRRMGRFDTANAIDEDTLARLRDLPAEQHDGTLTAMVESALASDRRALGRYEEAVNLDRHATQWFTEAFGERHPRTLMCASNLAYSLRMVGDLKQAKEVDHDVYLRRRELLTDLHPYTAFSASAYGRDLRDLGDLVGSRQFLEHALANYREALGPDHPDTLRAAKSLAVTLRRMGLFEEAHELSVVTWHTYNRKLGTKHPDTILCRLTMATTYAGKEDNETASVIGQAVVQDFHEILGENHVYTAMARNNLAVFDLKLGRPKPAAVRAILDALRAPLGDHHPVVLMVALNIANHQAALGTTKGTTDARWADRNTYDHLRSTFEEEDHPDVLAAAINLAIGMRACDEPEAEPFLRKALELATAKLGQGHPRVEAAQRGERWINTYIDPPPL